MNEKTLEIKMNEIKDSKKCLQWWLDRIKAKRPLLECLTNVVTINDVANVILACGASPVMADAADEVPDFVNIASGVIINVGSMINRGSYEIAMRYAQEYGKPVVIDPVGVGAAKPHTTLTMALLRRYPCAVIRGNASEIRTVAEGAGMTKGVDAAADDAVTDETIPARLAVVKAVANRWHCTVAMSGAIDLISDGKNSYACRNGVSWMSNVTGTGCSLTGLTAAFAAVAEKAEMAEAAAYATAMMGMAGEIAYDKAKSLGLGSFRVYLIDALSMILQHDVQPRLEIL